ncbi:MAG: cadherin-like domain-containing protein [Planctomycetes bacterium]|nr:cadherin-like domain-containing protein [Planctomycetota bacterium]
MNKLLRSFFVAALIIGSPSNLIFALTATDYYVDIGAAAGGDGSAALPWNTITEALDSGVLVDGDTVNIAAGIYDTESFPLDLVPGVTYNGAGSTTEVNFPSSLLGVANVFGITPGGALSNTTLSNISIDGLTGDGISVNTSTTATTGIVVSNVSYDGGGSGDLVNYQTYNVKSNLTIGNCDVTNGNILQLSMGFSSSMYSTAHNHIVVHNNSVTNAAWDAIDIDGARGANYEIFITDNTGDTIDDNAIVLEVHDVPIANITVSGNSWTNTGDEVISASINAFEFIELAIGGNTQVDSLDDGFTIYMSNSSSTTSAAAVVDITGNTFENTDYDAIELFVYGGGTTNHDFDVTINGNTITEAGYDGIGVSYGNYSGSHVEVHVNIANNTISGADTGITITNSLSHSLTASSGVLNVDFTLRNNTLTSNWENGVTIAAYGSSLVTTGIVYDLGKLVDSGNNTIHSNGVNHPDNTSTSSWGTSTAIAVSNSSAYSTIKIPAYGNDWGTTDLAEIEDHIYHQVDEPSLMLVLFDAGTPLPPTAPIAVYDERTPADCGPVVIDVADNDLDVNGDLDLDSVVITQNPAHGTVVVLGGGLVEYTADYAWVGADTFNYHISDVTGLVSNIATVQVDNPGNNELPEANYDAYTMSEVDGPQTYDIAANDTNPSGRALDLATVVITQAPHKGSLVNNLDGTVTYTFTGDLSGAQSTTDTFNYTIRDDCGALSNVATVEVEITRVGGVPSVTDNNFKLVAGEMTVGQSASINFVGATPNSTVKVYASRVHQLTNTQFGIGELGNPRFNLGAAQSNMFGSGSVSFTVPASLQGQTVWFQAMDTAEQALSAATSADVN